MNAAKMNKCRRQNRYTPVEKPPISLSALAQRWPRTPAARRDGELAMTFNISAVAACCSRASFRSLLGPETERCLTRVAAGAMRRLVLVVLRPFAGLALRAFASLFLPPVLDGRAISAPRSRRASYRARPSFRKGRIGLSRRLPAGQADFR